jgi:hypothetical protein
MRYFLLRSNDCRMSIIFADGQIQKSIDPKKWDSDTCKTVS